MVLFALTRWPGLMPPNFSAVYAMMFCAGVFFPRRLVWWLPFATMLVTDLLLNWYYHQRYGSPIFSPELFGNYAAYGVLIWLGRKFGPKASFLSLLGGGLLGAMLFYFITNSLSWLFNPFHNLEYTRDFAGWLIAMTKGTAGWPSTIEFFRNNLGSGGLFTAIFAGAMKLMGAESPSEKEAPEEKAQAEETPEAEEVKA
jgi:hypothetical protein